RPRLPARGARPLRHRAAVERCAADGVRRGRGGAGRAPLVAASGRPVVLIVLDGFGLGDRGPGDATALAHAPFFAAAYRRWPHAKLETSGEAVGLPAGQMGNSEVGHMTMGAGRIRYQEITRISKAFAEVGVEGVPALADALDVAAAGRGRLHLLGLVSDGGVHSHVDHLVSLLEACGRRGVQPVVHAFLDGRDTPPRSGLDYLKQLLPHVEAAGGRIATVTGRYFAMDRDERWDRIGRAYHALVCREGLEATSAIEAVEAAYGRGEGDEFVQPTVVAGGAPIEDGDVVVFFNFRGDRARELTNALTGVKARRFAGRLERRKVVSLARFVCMTEYDAEFGLPVA